MPNITDTIKGKEDLSEIATMMRRTAVAGKPQMTPKANLLSSVVVSP